MIARESLIPVRLAPCAKCGTTPVQRTRRSPSGGNARHAFVCLTCDNGTKYHRTGKRGGGWLGAYMEWAIMNSPVKRL